MFGYLARIAAGYRLSVLAAWILALIALQVAGPAWDAVVTDGEFNFLPDEMPSREGEALYSQAFSRDVLGSTLVIVARRPVGDQGLLQRDYDFIEDVLKPRLQLIADEQGGLADEGGRDVEGRSVIRRIRTFSDPLLGPLLQSRDRKATLAIVELTTGFMDKVNWPTIQQVENLIGEEGELRQKGLIPPGLDLALSGTATVGRDMRLAAEQSGNATELWTVLLVVVLLLAIYRAPLLALIPLVTVGVAVHIALRLLAVLAGAEVVDLFAGIEIYVTVVLYGAGVDYCMFLMARYKEELDAGYTFDEAMTRSIERVGAALTASAGTTICGIGMMVFAEFGKFQQAGVAMSFSLIAVLLASLTFTPALLLVCGRWAFWPNVRSERIAAASGWITPTTLIARLAETEWFRSVWTGIGRALVARPGTILVASLLVMAPFAVVAVVLHDHLSYGLLSELPQDQPSVVGARAVQEHFPAGQTGPVTVLLHNPAINFREPAGWQAVDELTDRLDARREELGIADLRSIAEPLGDVGQNRSGRQSNLARKLAEERIMREKGFSYYVSDKGKLAGQITRIDLVLDSDPFSHGSLQQFDRLGETIRRSVRDEFGPVVEKIAGAASQPQTRILYIGATPSIRDLKTVTSRDQIRIDVLVLAAVFLVLVVLLRGVAVPAYLIVSVFFSYLVTLGATFAVFWALDPTGFAGLDWKVPMFLFTILIAVGEDYNIYLMTRIGEEQRRYGQIRGITVALVKTGSIISSCGLIMAGTFASLLAGSLTGMHQLGFALAFGVMLDTFVVRPILVPAWLILLHSGRFGTLGRFLGADPEQPLPRIEEPRAPHFPVATDQHVQA